jgi:hypothetical protein
LDSSEDEFVQEPLNSKPEQCAPHPASEQPDYDDPRVVVNSERDRGGSLPQKAHGTPAEAGACKIKDGKAAGAAAAAKEGAQKLLKQTVGSNATNEAPAVLSTSRVKPKLAGNGAGPVSATMLLKRTKPKDSTKGKTQGAVTAAGAAFGKKRPSFFEGYEQYGRPKVGSAPNAAVASQSQRRSVCCSAICRQIAAIIVACGRTSELFLPSILMVVCRVYGSVGCDALA